MHTSGHTPAQATISPRAARAPYRAAKLSLVRNDRPLDRPAILRPDPFGWRARAFLAALIGAHYRSIEAMRSAGCEQHQHRL